MEKVRKWLKNNYSYILVICLALIIRQTKLIGINIVEGTSMVPTLHDGQILIGSSIKTINRNDIVVAKRPESNNAKLVIKRIIGLPGEVVEYVDGTLYIDGNPIEEPYIEKGRDSASKTQTWKFEIPEGHYLIIGDNRDGSYDGRYYGPVPEKEILEKIYIFF